MCNILILEPGQSIEKRKFYNMCYNNWHSWGMVTKVGDRLDVQRHVPESGEIDPEEVWKAVEKDKDYLRFLHVRHTTAGQTDLDNCHPFDVYYNQKTGRHVLFMHNGTLHEFKSKKPGTYHNSWIDDDSGPSDTKNFVDKILIPYVAQADFGDGIGSLTPSALKVLLGRFWSSSNRGLLISSQDPFLLLGKSEWKEIESEDGKGTVWSANDLYFENVTRGPEKDRRDAAEKERLRIEEEEKAYEKRKEGAQASTTNGSALTEPKAPTLTKLSEVTMRGKHPFFGLSEGLSNLLNDWDFYGDDRVGRAALAFCTDKELEDLYKEKDTCIWVMDYMFSDYAQILDDLEKSEDKKQKGELVIAAQKKKIEELEAELQAKEGVLAASSIKEAA